MEWYDKVSGRRYKLFTRKLYPFATITQQEEDDLKAMIRVKDANFKVIMGKNDVEPLIDKLMDDAGDVYNKFTNDQKILSIWGLFLVVPFILFFLFIVVCYAALFAKRICIQKELYSEEIPIIYKDTIKMIEERYENRIVKLARIEDEKD